MRKLTQNTGDFTVLGLGWLEEEEFLFFWARYPLMVGVQINKPVTKIFYIYTYNDFTLIEKC